MSFFRFCSYKIDILIEILIDATTNVSSHYLGILEAFADGIIGHQISEPFREDQKKRVHVGAQGRGSLVVLFGLIPICVKRDA